MTATQPRRQVKLYSEGPHSFPPGIPQDWVIAPCQHTRPAPRKDLQSCLLSAETAKPCPYPPSTIIIRGTGGGGGTCGICPPGPQGQQGPAGENGTFWFVGQGDPTVDPPNPPNPQQNDIYLNTDNGEVWFFDNGMWVDSGGSIMGPPGPPGADGTDGTDGAVGPAGPPGTGLPLFSVFLTTTGAPIGDGLSVGLTGPWGTAVTGYFNNIGSGFNPLSGLWIVPATGTYLLNMQFQIAVNGTLVADTVYTGGVLVILNNLTPVAGNNISIVRDNTTNPSPSLITITQTCLLALTIGQAITLRYTSTVPFEDGANLTVQGGDAPPLTWWNVMRVS